MSLWKIAWRSIQQRALASSMTGLSMALGVTLVVAVLVFQGVIRKSFSRAAEGYDILVGAKGGRLELVLNTVFHLGQPIENVPWDFYKEFTKQGPTGANRPGRYSSVVDVAVPYCLGDNYKGYRVVGTTPDLFDKLGYAIDDTGKAVPYRFSSGQCYAADDYFGAVIGAVVASRTGLKVGDSFEPTHGVSADEELGHKHDPFIVRGILAPNGTPNDRALFVNMEGFFLLEGHAKPVETKKPAKAQAQPAAAAVPATAGKPATDGEQPASNENESSSNQPAEPAAVEKPTAETPEEKHDHAHGHDHGHEHHHHGPLPEEEREITAILIRTNNPTAGLTLPRSINKGQIAQAVLPISEIRKLFDGLIGNLQLILLVLSVLIVVVAGIGIMVSIYSSMNDRRRDIAVMRALGASRQTVMAIILLESVLLSVLAGGVGFLLGHGLIGLLSPSIAGYTGVPIGFTHFVPAELALIPSLILLASLAGFLPALTAYRTDVAKALSDSP